MHLRLSHLFSERTNMKRFYQLAVTAALIALTSQAALAADYTIAPTPSSVSFTIRHLVSKVTGHFNDFEGTFTFDAKSPAASTGNVSIKTASISTDNDKRDT